MFPIAAVLVWAGYAVSSWGYVLVKGWDISLREWVSPLHPYRFSGTPAKLPDTVILPGQSSATSGGAAEASGAAGGGAAGEAGLGSPAQLA